ncbi:MAG: prepilin-type N-terminal cleavage/methylation domain-containing protein [bacterium]
MSKELQLMIKNNNKGFSLIELMVVVGIIGILAAVAVPNLLKFQAKAKQSNAKTELSAIYGTEKAFYVEYSIYSSYLKYLGYAPDGVPTANGCVDNTADPTKIDYNSGTSTTWPTRYYSVGFQTAVGAPTSLGTAPVAGTACASTFVRATIGIKGAVDPKLTKADGLTLSTVAAKTADPVFTVHAKGRISTADTTVTYDEWTINQAKVLLNATIGY